MKFKEMEGFSDPVLYALDPDDFLDVKREEHIPGLGYMVTLASGESIIVPPNIYNHYLKHMENQKAPEIPTSIDLTKEPLPRDTGPLPPEPEYSRLKKLAKVKPKLAGPRKKKRKK